MAILTSKQVWRRPPNPRGHKSQRELARLTPIEEQRVRRALWVLHVRYGNWTQVAKALGYHHITVERPEHFEEPRRSPSPCGCPRSWA